uniref:Alternative protein PDZD2 n=1 Tax=Homo sapiens TaxID=9606 RepID=L8E9S3_HUMAN|nr:alternative protein PDZD2 [Homo sapiens]
MATVATALNQEKHLPWSWVTELRKRGNEPESLGSSPGLLPTRPLKNPRAALAVRCPVTPALSWRTALTLNLETAMSFS